MKQIKKQQREENAMEGKEKKGKNELTKKTYIIIRSLNCLLKVYHVSCKKEKVLIIVWSNFRRQFIVKLNSSSIIQYICKPSSVISGADDVEPNFLRSYDETPNLIKHLK